MALTVAQLTARLTADTSNFYKSMSIADASLLRTGSIAKRVGTGTAIAVGAIGIMALKTAGDFEQSMNILGATSGATTGQMKDMQAQAIALGKDMKLPNVSAKDAADAMTELSKSGMSVNNIMGATRGVLQLGVAANMDFATSATVVARALTAFHMRGSEATKVADLFSAAANKSTADVNDMALGVQMASAQWYAGRQPLENLTTALALMANAGQAGSDAGTSLKTMMNRLMAPTDKARALMKDLGISVYDSSGHMKKMPAIIDTLSRGLKGQSEAQRNANLYTIFGSDAIRSARVLITGGTAAWDRMANSITKGGEAQKMAEARTKGFNGAVQGFISQIETLAVELGLKMLPAATRAARGLADFTGSIDTSKITDFFGVIASGIRIFFDFATSNTRLTQLIITSAAAFAVLKFAISPLIGMFGTLNTVAKAFGVTLALNPMTAFVGVALALGAGMGLLTHALQDTAVSARDVADALTAAKDASLNLENATNGVEGANIGLIQSQSAATAAHKALSSAQAEANRLGLEGAARQRYLADATLAARTADNNLAQAKAHLHSALNEEGKAVSETIRSYTDSISKAKTHRDQVNLTSYAMAHSSTVVKDRADADKNLNSIVKEAIDYSNKHAKAIKDVSDNGGPAAKSMKDFSRTIKDFSLKTGTDKLKDFDKALQDTKTRTEGQATLIGSGISSGIAGGIDAAPVIAAAVKAVTDAISAAKNAAGIRSPSKVANETIGAPISQGIAQGILKDSTKAEYAAMSVIQKTVSSGIMKAIPGGYEISKKFTDSMLSAWIHGTETLPDKIDKTLTKLINRAKSVLDKSKPVFDKWFSRLSSQALKAFDAVTQAHRTPSELALAGKTPAEQALASEQAARDTAALNKREAEAQAIIDGAAGRKSAIQQQAGEDWLAYQQRLASESAAIDAEVVAARQTLDDVAWERKRATLETNAASERAILETNATQERLDYESMREIQRTNLEDRLTALENHLLSGKLSTKNMNKEIIKLLKDFGPDYKDSGKILGINFAAGLAATRKRIVGEATKIAAAIQAILKLNSPAKEGPLSTLNTWWDAFVPTLTSGLDTRGLSSSVAGAVTRPSISGLGVSSVSGATINLTVTDQTFAGMSREQADRVAREVQAAMDRQVRSSV